MEKRVHLSYIHTIACQPPGHKHSQDFQRAETGTWGRMKRPFYRVHEQDEQQISTEAGPRSMGTYGEPPEGERKNRGKKQNLAWQAKDSWIWAQDILTLASSECKYPPRNLAHFNNFNHVCKSHIHLSWSEFLSLRAWLGPLTFGSQYSLWYKNNEDKLCEALCWAVQAGSHLLLTAREVGTSPLCERKLRFRETQ